MNQNENKQAWYCPTGSHHSPLDLEYYLVFVHVFVAHMQSIQGLFILALPSSADISITTATQ